MDHDKSQAPIISGGSSSTSAEHDRPPVKKTSGDGLNEFGPLEHLSLMMILKDLSGRLSALEANLSESAKEQRKSSGRLFIEMLKILLGGWPAFAFIFLVLFYSPLHAALMAIPERVRAGDEIQLPGVSLKATIRSVAVSQGVEGLGDTIPKLSSHSIELLLRAPQRPESLVSYTNSADFKTNTSINYPSDADLKALIELKEKDLILLTAGFGASGQLDAAKLQQLLTNMKTKFPGFLESDPEEQRNIWKLNEPLPAGTKDLPNIMWSLTDTGSKALNVILKAISTQLLETEAPKGK